ncbi:Hint domain-containing protein [Actibacterium sp. D379-3]
MTRASKWRAGQCARRTAACIDPGGLAEGTTILTLDGALPVEFLSPGDRIVTRNGARSLRRLTAHRLTGAPYRISPGALGHDNPDREMFLAPGQKLLIRDWRAQALYGAKQALVPVARLADGTYIARAAGKVGLRLYALEFDGDEIFYADGMEVASAPRATVTA